MTDEEIEIMKKMAETQDREHEEFRAKEWFWSWPDAEVSQIVSGWIVFWSQFTPSGKEPIYAEGATKIEAVLNAYRKAQEMEGDNE